MSLPLPIAFALVTMAVPMTARLADTKVVRRICEKLKLI
jgi:hypothetical protein